MGIFDFLKGRGAGHDLDELARRLGYAPDELARIEIAYRSFDLPKRSGRGVRRITAPAPALKATQRRVHRRLLALLVVHPACIGFERGKSIVDHASAHVGRAVVVRVDVRDFFPTTRAKRVHAFFERIGWNRVAARRLAELCTIDGGLPQGAPSSPRLANLVNYGMDARLDALAQRFRGVYTRYADDLTFSLPAETASEVGMLVHVVRLITGEHGYRVHTGRKLHVRRRHQQQRVTGLVVNERVNLPRDVRRRLRAIEHRIATGRPATLTEDQMQGWRAYRAMIELRPEA